MDVIDLIRNEGIRRGLRPQTIRTYSTCLTKFFRIYTKNPLSVKRSDILHYIDQMQQWGKADNTINVHLHALRFLYENVLGKKLMYKIPYPRTRKRLPTFLTKQETKDLIAAINNPKHQLMIKLLYATGMRVSELIKLKIQHIEFNENYGWIRDGKGGKDRLFIIGKKLKAEILAWISSHKLESHDFVFPGYTTGHMSAQSLQKIIKSAAIKANINKNVHPHTLRHSFATHLIENGYAINEVQPLLGHQSLQTTMIYLHMASPQLLKVQSPYELLYETT